MNSWFQTLNFTNIHFTVDIKVVVFEDNDQLREMLFQMINISEGLSCTGAYSNAMDLEFKILRSQPEIVLMDIDMPGISGIEAVKIICDKFPAVKVMMQTVFEDSNKVFDSICAGASGYLLKNTLSEQIVTAIKELNKGGAPMSPGIAKKVLNRFQEQNPYIKKDDYKLSEREIQVLTCLMKGMSYKMIADACFISIDTVKFHIKKIYEKLQVNSKSEAVIKAMRNRIV
ncbi:MAG: response regulator transcription factor [Chitinophagaceae bacterium]